jgi:hypothetical protein
MNEELSTLAAATEPITIGESRRLIELEKIIEAGRQTFIEVGTALEEIRDARLYKADFKTFEDYCTHKWGFKRAHAHRLIEAAGIANELSPIGDIKTESQARELVKVPKEKREAVIKTAAAKAEAAGRKLTARDISDAAQPQSTATSIAPKPEPGIRHIFPAAAMKEKKKVQRWWYHNATPETRGNFFHMIISHHKPVEVKNLEWFTTVVKEWLAEDVHQMGGEK